VIPEEGDQEVAQKTAQTTAERCAELMWADDRASQALGMKVVEVGPGTATVSMTVRADMVNGHGIGHGGLTFTLADTAFAFACNTYNRRTVAQAAEIERSREGRDGTYDIAVHTGDTLVAEFVGRSKEIRGTFFTDEEM
jgi:acyl-CoA thioesterase